MFFLLAKFCRLEASQYATNLSSTSAEPEHNSVRGDMRTLDRWNLSRFESQESINWGTLEIRSNNIVSSSSLPNLNSSNNHDNSIRDTFLTMSYDGQTNENTSIAETSASMLRPKFKVEKTNVDYVSRPLKLKFLYQRERKRLANERETAKARTLN